MSERQYIVLSRVCIGFTILFAYIGVMRFVDGLVNPDLTRTETMLRVFQSALWDFSR